MVGEGVEGFLGGSDDWVFEGCADGGGELLCL